MARSPADPAPSAAHPIPAHPSLPPPPPSSHHPRPTPPPSTTTTTARASLLLCSSPLLLCSPVARQSHAAGPTLLPTWHETFEFRGPSLSALKARPLQLKLYDLRRGFRAGYYVGRAHADLRPQRALRSRETVELVLPLSSGGIVVVELRWCPEPLRWRDIHRNIRPLVADKWFGLTRRLFKFRALLLYSYLPYDKTIYGKLVDPVCLSLMVFASLPFYYGAVRAVFFSVLLACFLVDTELPEKASEDQLMTFILNLKGTQFFSGLALLGLGYGQFHYCALRTLPICDVAGPGSGWLVPEQVAMLLYTQMLVWGAFLLLRRAAAAAVAREREDAAGISEAAKGGRPTKKSLTRAAKTGARQAAMVRQTVQAAMEGATSWAMDKVGRGGFERLRESSVSSQMEAGSVPPPPARCGSGGGGGGGKARARSASGAMGTAGAAGQPASQQPPRTNDEGRRRGRSLDEASVSSAFAEASALSASATSARDESFEGDARGRRATSLHELSSGSMHRTATTAAAAATATAATATNAATVAPAAAVMTAEPAATDPNPAAAPAVPEAAWAHQRWMEQRQASSVGLLEREASTMGLSDGSSGEVSSEGEQAADGAAEAEASTAAAAIAEEEEEVVVVDGERNEKGREEDERRKDLRQRGDDRGGDAAAANDAFLRSLDDDDVAAKRARGEGGGGRHGGGGDDDDDEDEAAELARTTATRSRWAGWWARTGEWADITNYLDFAWPQQPSAVAPSVSREGERARERKRDVPVCLGLSRRIGRLRACPLHALCMRA